MSDSPRIEFEANPDDVTVTIPLTFRVIVGDRVREATRTITIPLGEFKVEGIRAAIAREDAEPEPNLWRAFSACRPPVGATIEYSWHFGGRIIVHHRVATVGDGTLKPNNAEYGGFATHWKYARNND